ncbi:MAG: gliding motility protein GldN [Clostridium sp.]|nr:gliding motility protein GldN [Clostridium sp.]
MKRLLFLIWGICLMGQVQAQPTKRRAQTSQGQTTTSSPANRNDRASLQFPTAVAMPADMVWRRDIYRQLDLLEDKNGPLYYPAEPSGAQMNLFTYMFRLLLAGRINAYEYKLDGNESFAATSKIDVKDFLERYRIYYEEKDGHYQVNVSDIPSAEVTRYYIKESSYFDQRTSTFHSKVTALCPVLVRGDDFGGESTPYPLFWLNYEEVSPFLARLPLMASNLNNVTNMTADDYFTLNRYEGKIYKTNNLRGQVLANYCKTDSALVKEQKRIEEQLTDFEKNIWGKVVKEETAPADSTDSVTVVVPEKKVKASARTARTSSARRGTAASSRSSQTEAKSAKTKTKKSSSSGPSAPRVSVRRQRR